MKARNLLLGMVAIPLASMLPPEPKPGGVVHLAPIHAQGHWQHDACLLLPDAQLRRCLMEADALHYAVRSRPLGAGELY